jgi:hypothetical protein
MRKTTALRFIVGAGYGVGFGRPTQSARRLHPRRDEGGHEGGKPEGEGGKSKKPVIVPDDDEPKTFSEEHVKKIQDTAAWLYAEQQHKLKLEQDKNKTDADREFDRRVEEKAKELASEGSVELLTRISDLQIDRVTDLIDAHLDAKRIDKKKVETVLATLDKEKFLNEDGSVNKDLVKRWADGLTAEQQSRPPRNGKSSGSFDSNDRGFGKYLDK